MRRTLPHEWDTNSLLANNFLAGFESLGADYNTPYTFSSPGHKS